MANRTAVLANQPTGKVKGTRVYWHGMACDVSDQGTLVSRYTKGDLRVEVLWDANPDNPKPPFEYASKLGVVGKPCDCGRCGK